MGDEQPWRSPAVRTVTGPASSDEPLSVEEYARTLRDLVPDAAAEVAERIQNEVPAYAGRPDGRRRELITHTVEQATHLFLDSIDGLPHRDRGVDEMFRALARADATGTGDLAAMQAALRLAAAATWDRMRRVHVERPVSEDARGQLADALFLFIEHLVEQAELGYTAGRRLIEGDRGLARARLAEQLLSGRRRAPLSEVDPELWHSPESVVVAVSDPDTERRVDVATLALTHLVVRHERRVIVIADAQRATTLVKELARFGPRFAITWPVEPSAVSSAFRWARRALELVRRGVIPAQAVIDCRQHRTQIWLHAEPALRQRMCQDLLKPLLAESPNSREILSQTLLTWLETRDSAPAIAAQLGVHPQTVRYRWKRINELFGDDLHDPEFIVQITMLLKASVPLWQAGDQSDFERFRAEVDA